MAEGFKLKPTTSASQLTSYSMCPRKYAFSSVWNVEPEFRSVAMVTGTIVHGGVDWWYGERLAGRVPTFAQLDMIVESDVLATTTDDTTLRWKDGNPDQLEVDAKRLLRAYLTDHGDLPVSAIEHPFRVPLIDPDTGLTVGRDLAGFFDLVLTEDKIVELKTSSRGWREDDLARHIQVGSYAYAYNTMHGGPSQIEVHVIVKLKGTPRVEKYSIERGEADIGWFIQAAAAIESAIAAGHFPPAPSMLCNECEYQSACLRMTHAVNVRELPANAPHHLQVVA
ncbi:MAG: RecB family exonuclease [Polyangiales bacterium]